MTPSDGTRIAVVGTDTGVGKTVVTAALTARLRDRGIDARTVKPVQTGYPPDDDAQVVARTCGDPEAATCLRYLEAPLAPRVAAERDGDTVDVSLEYEQVLADCERELETAEIGLLEGIGGLRVPLAGDREVIDLVDDLDCEAILVSRSGLGTLNHTALSVDALDRRGIEVRGIVLNGYAGETVAERTNPAELERMTGLPVETLPRVERDDAEPAVVAAGLCDSVSASLLREFVPSSSLDPER
ncbi:dethiobiotin synthase [Natronoglomus mannanivorans]|uniref:ATP-dependent dethiobiotin synthetase BioD n=1 Tax=Natronoglomus mannanivorans TaxID=2979990 RepID=A0AAP3E2G9_9EURY|nr:dethiobiotin synthase [Halobacteria archaeon AArc-xg1-1]